ncbi:MAG: transcription/translation regulatory transformer protein RfaH [Pseudomonadota bacterium]|nr:transcription/translation regulatory transformer protein RfaH [Pseudomonadota bacterium]
MKNWYLIYTKPHKEQLARENLERQGYEIYLPMARLRRRRMGKGAIRIVPLFPRYLFIHLDTKTDNWSPIRSTLGVSNLVKFGMYPSAVPAALIELLCDRCDEEGIQDIIPDEYKEGEAIRVMEGPMTGLEGVFLAKTSSDRVMVLLDIVGKHTRVSMVTEKLGPVG